MASKLLLLNFIFLLFFSFGQAQNEKTKQPLVKILNKLEQRYDCQFSYADKTIAGISISMPPKSLSFSESLAYLKKKTNLNIIRIGEKSATLEPKKTGPIAISLDSVQYLQRILLKNYVAQGIEKKNGGRFQIDFQKFGPLPGLIETDVLKTLEALPGVESIDETVSHLNIHGGTSDQNLVLWDGIRMFQTGHFFGLISAFDPYQTQTATLIKNGTNPALGNSVSGVVKMNSAKYVNRDFTGEAGLDFLSGQGFVDVPVSKKVSVQVSGRKSINKVVKTPTYRNYYDRAFQQTEITENSTSLPNSNVDFSFYDLSTRWLYRPSEKDKFRLNFIHISNELAFNENDIVNAKFQSRESRLSQHSTAAGLFYKRFWNDNFRSSAQFYFSTYKLNSKNADITKGLSLKQDNDISEFGAKLNTVLRFNNKLSWQNGYEYTETNVTNFRDGFSSMEQIDESQDLGTHALFSNFMFQSLNRKTSLAFGGRLIYFQNFDDFRLEPRLSFTQSLFKNVTMEVLGEMKSQGTTQVIDFQTDFFGIEKRRWRLADQNDIPLLKSKQVSLDLDYQHKGWLISAETYLKKVEGITSQSQAFRGKFEFAQITGNYKVAGLDLLLKKKIGDFSFWSSYALTNNTYEFLGLDRAKAPSNIEIVNSLTLATAFSKDGLKFSLGLKLRDGKPFTALTQNGFFSNQFDYETTNSSNLKNYASVNIAVSQRFNLFSKVKAYAGLSIINLLDRDNILDSYYEKRNGSIKRIDRKALGLTPNLVFRVKF